MNPSFVSMEENRPHAAKADQPAKIIKSTRLGRPPKLVKSNTSKRSKPGNGRKPVKRRLRNNLAELGPVTTKDVDSRPKRVPRVAARKAQESVAALSENTSDGNMVSNENTDGNMAVSNENTDGNMAVSNENTDANMPELHGNTSDEKVATPRGNVNVQLLLATKPLSLQDSPIIRSKMSNLMHAGDVAVSESTSAVPESTSAVPDSTAPSTSPVPDSTAPSTAPSPDSTAPPPTFVEPQLAVPKPGFSGHTLESLPPAKVKRAAVTTGKGKRGRKPASAAQKPDDGLSAEREKLYISHLQTVKSETLCQPSELRQRAPQQRKLPHAKSLVIPIPATPSSTFSHHLSPGRSIKRLKITSPKRPPTLMARTAPAIPEASDDNNNDDFCSTCGGTGVFICCDSCPKSFHLLCCNPPLQEIPDENWNCTECLAKYDLIPKKSYKSYGMFGGLLDTIHGRNPTEFRLPKKLRDATFMDVSTGEDFQYSDGSMKPDLPVQKNAQLNGFNKNEELDVEALYDADGKPRFCHKCKMSGLQRRTMVSCDFCPLWWHLDCLPGVVCSAKTLGQKWRCPNHVDSMIPSHWLERRSFKDALVLDASVHNNFLSFVQANNFLIKYRNQPFLSENADVTMQEYSQAMAHEANTIDKFEHKYGDYSQVESDQDDDVDSNYKVPAYMQNYAIDKKVTAKSCTKLARLLLMTNGKGMQPFIYRVPEQSIVLDFINSTNKGEIKKNIAYYEENQKIACEEEEDAVKVLLSMQKGGEEEGDFGFRNGLESSELRNFGLENSELENSELENSEMKESESKESELKSSELKSSELKNSELKESELENSEMKESESKKSELNSSELKESESKESELKESESKESESKESESKESEFKQSEFKQSEFKQSELNTSQFNQSKLIPKSNVPFSQKNQLKIKNSNGLCNGLKDSTEKISSNPNQSQKEEKTLESDPQLQEILRLIELKGKDKLMEFLRS